jgi:hypothetical protein
MADIFSLDFETYSTADLKNFGAYRYASDPSTEILIFAIAKNDGRVLVWDLLNSFGQNDAAFCLFKEAIDTGGLIYAHNAQFEAAICRYVLKRQFSRLRCPKLDQWRCTAAMARRAAIPSSLAGVGDFLGLDVVKDKTGAALIRKFSIPRWPTKGDPRTRIEPQDDREAFRQFGEYCRQDVETERAAHKVLHAFELEGGVLESFQFDLRMNEAGVPVNVEALKLADKLINEYSARLSGHFREMTGLNHTQRDKVHEWLRERGYPFPNLQAANVDVVLESGRNGWEMRYVEHKRELAGRRWLNAHEEQLPAKFKAPKLQPVEMTKEAFEALRVRSLVSYAAVKKVPTMLNAVCPDGRVRGALLWSGAERTHRWAGRIIQPQNFRRPSFKGTERAYEMLCDGVDIDTLEMLFVPFLEIIASCIRHFIQLPNDQQMLQADFSSVEARGAPWLCGGQKKLEMFKRDEPIYETMAAKIFGINVADVTKDQRFIGKQAELGCTYNMGRPKFRGTCEGWNFAPPESMVEAFKPRFRKELAQMIESCKNPEPWDEFEIKFPRFKWARLRNSKNGRTLSVMAYRKAPSGKAATARKVADPHNPTAEEWLDLTYDDLADRAVTTWRNDNPEIVTAWKTIDKAAKQAIQNPGKIFNGTDKISFGVTAKPGFRALVMKLPSGHTLVYPKAKLVWKGEGEPNPEDYYNIEIHFWGKVKNVWCWCKTYGGKLLENATQAICGDFMANGAVNASKHGYDIFMLVHDEAIGPQKPGQTQEELCKLLCQLPKWAAGMPLAADGNVIPFYKKT